MVGTVVGVVVGTVVAGTVVVGTVVVGTVVAGTVVTGTVVVGLLVVVTLGWSLELQALNRVRASARITTIISAFLMVLPRFDNGDSVCEDIRYPL